MGNRFDAEYYNLFKTIYLELTPQPSKACYDNEIIYLSKTELIDKYESYR